MTGDSNDPRLTNQESYLKGLTLHRREYRAPRPDWDHDHCKLCWETFMNRGTPETLHEGYCTGDEYYWVCPQCFEDFKDRFEWTLAPGSGEPGSASG